MWLKITIFKSNQRSTEMNQQFVVYFVSQTKQNMHKFIENQLIKEGMDDLIPSHGSILTVLYNHEGPLTMKEIAEKIGKDKSTVTVLINTLLYKGYIKKNVSKEDRRITFIELTELGQSKEVKYREISKKVVETAYDYFTEDEKETFLALLKKMNSNFKTANNDGGNRNEGNE